VCDSVCESQETPVGLRYSTGYQIIKDKVHFATSFLYNLTGYHLITCTLLLGQPEIGLKKPFSLELSDTNVYYAYS
jgi:hypothetical protein